MRSSLHLSFRASRRHQPTHAKPIGEPLETRRLLASIAVNSAGDSLAADGLVTLREAIIAANTDTATEGGQAGSGNDTITFDADAFATPQTIQLASALPALSSDMSIAGPGAERLTVRGLGVSGSALALNGPPVFHVAVGAVDLSGLTVTNGRRGVLNHATLTLSDSVVANNFVPHQTLPPGGPVLSGGGIDNTGTLTVRSSTFFGNFAARGGGIANTGTLTVQSTTFDSNPALFDGGGVYNSGSLTVENSVFINNHAGSGVSSSRRGGALFNAAGTATIQNSTLSGNEAGNGGGIYNTAALTVQNSTIVLNRSNPDGSAAGIFNGAGAVLTAHNTIIAANGFSDLQNSGTVFLEGVFMNGDPKLGQLQDNGGPTLTHLPLAGSPVIDAGVNELIPAGMTTDQRGAGFPRIFGGTVDIGAVELNNTTPTATAAVPAVNITEDAADIVIDLKNFFDDVEDGPAGLSYGVVDFSNPELFEFWSIEDGLLTLALTPDASGTTEVRVRATDSGGLFIEQTLSVTVVSAADQLQLLQKQVAALPELNPATINSLLVKLDFAGNSSGDSGKVSAFMRQVEVLISTGKISAADGLALLNAAEDLLVSVA